MTTARRVQKEKKMLEEKNGGSFCYFSFPETNRWIVSIGGFESIYSKVLEFEFKLPAEYPFKPPQVHCLSTITHPNIDPMTGRVGLDELKDSWHPAFTIERVFFLILKLLEKPSPYFILNKTAKINNNNNNNNNNNYNLYFCRDGELFPLIKEHMNQALDTHPPNCSIETIYNYQWLITIKAESNNQFNGLIYEFYIFFPYLYPQIAPQIQCINRGKHPNIHPMNGYLNFRYLDDWKQSSPFLYSLPSSSSSYSFGDDFTISKLIFSIVDLFVTFDSSFVVDHNAILSLNNSSSDRIRSNDLIDFLEY